MKIKKNTKKIILLISITLLLILGTFDNLLASFITYNPNNSVMNHTVITKLKTSTYKDQQIIWGNISVQEQGSDVAVDSLGNIYITGNYLEPLIGDLKVLLVSFDKYGNYRWNKTWSDSGLDFGSSIVIDSSNNILIAGQARNITDTNALILKYDSSGNYLENITWGINGFDVAYGIVLDSEENIYITGSTESRTIAGSRDIFLAKYNSSGLEWQKILPGTSNADDGYDLAVDLYDNIHLVGYNSSTAASERDIVIFKYDSDGNHLWNATWNNAQDQRGYSIEVDSKNNVYVTGYNRTLTDYDIIILKYNSSGHLEKETSWDGNFINDIDWGRGIDIDSKDNIYIIGESEMTSSYYNVTLIKLNSSLDIEWFKAWGGSQHDKGRGVVVDELLDNIYITGMTISYSLDSYDDIFLLKYIEYPPETFDLDSDAEDPDPDGNFNLSWKNSLRADNYSLYQYSSYITEYNESLDALVEETTDTSYPLTDYTNGIYYFIVRAYNIIGTTLSNCINVTVDISPPTPPSSFTLSSDAGTPDNDGNFTLTWTSSSGAKNYSVYQYSSYITKINESLTLLEEETDALSLPLTGYSDGDYYFIVVASNNFGNTLSNTLKIEVELAPEKRKNGVISGYNLMFLVCAIIGVASILLYRRLKFK